MTTLARDMHNAIADGLRSIGYADELLREKYDYSDLPVVAATAQSTVHRVELAAFAQSPPSMRNACFGVFTAPDDSPRHVEPFRVLGAPAVFALRPDAGYALMWKIPASGEPTVHQRIDASDIAETFQRNKADWNPQNVLRAKRVTFLNDAPQLDFCDVGLLPALEGQLRDKLYTRLNNITLQCEDRYKEFYQDAQAEEYMVPLFRLLFRLLAAKLLADRGEQSTWRDLNAQEAISAVENYYRSSATAQPALEFEPVQNVAWKALHDGLNLQNLSVETLAHLYENLFVTREVRQTLSVHATPPAIAEYLIRQLPIESLDVNKRIVFEPFSGAAPFLIAALGRLRELLPGEWSPRDRHDYFVHSLMGIEMDPFSVEIARFALILADYPNPDGWRILEASAFEEASNSEDSIFTKCLREANIVVCNPPYGKFDSLLRQDLGSDTALTKEGEALRRILLTTPDMLGVVLPRAVLDRRDFAPLRKSLADSYTNISITVFPDVAFNMASQEVVVIAAHNVATDALPYSFAQVYSGDYKRFQKTGDVSWRDKIDAISRTDDDATLWQTALKPVWDALSSNQALGEIARVHTGVRYTTGSINQNISSQPKSNFVPGVHTVRGYLEPFLIADHQFLNTLPEAMYNQSHKLPWRLPKVIVNRALLSRGRWHITSAVDVEGLWAYCQFYGVWPKGDVTVEILSALISGPVANAHLFEYPSKRENQSQWIKRIPVPRLSTNQSEIITALVRGYASYRGQWLAEPRRGGYLAGRCLELLFQIDAAVLEAYALPAELERRLLDAFTGQKRPGLPFDFPGYGAEYEEAKRNLQQEKAYRSTVERYHILVDKEFLSGLTQEETDEQEILSQQIDRHNAPFYEGIFDQMDAKKR
ncbi:MAG: N-6 DNA methylase [Fibrella sp.]|nr:N-6 DNA methylase [Armatimonadota bacterium]